MFTVFAGPTDLSGGEEQMSAHPLRLLIEAADQAITREDYDRLMDFYTDDAVLVIKSGMQATGKDQIRRAFVAIADHFDHSIEVS
jgi:ketosteroid isomerase-like protein